MINKDVMKNQNIDLISEEIKSYLDHLQILSRLRNESKGNAAEFSVFSFGKPAVANYEIVGNEEGVKINVDLDFSSKTWEDDNENKVVADFDLDKERTGIDDPRHWIGCEHYDGFKRLLNKNEIDFEAVKQYLKEYYNIDFGLTYDEKSYSQTEHFGSDGRESSTRRVYYKVDSHMLVSGRALYLEENNENVPKM